MPHSVPDVATQDGDFFVRARARLNFDIPAALTDADIVPVHGDQLVDPVRAALASVRPIRPAAVLIGVVDRDEPMVVLTQRAGHLNDHAGQIAFPGGKIDPGDETPLAAALREAQEEIGLSENDADPIGYLDLYMTTRGYRILPVVARVKSDYKTALNKSEVEDCFEVPLSFLMQITNYQERAHEWRGTTRIYYDTHFNDRRIWGVTAGIIRNLYEKLFVS